MTVKKEDILQWLIKFGHEWVDWNDVYDLIDMEVVGDILEWHDAMLVTKRTKLITYKSVSLFSKEFKKFDIAHAQYRLTKRAITMLEEA